MHAGANKSLRFKRLGIKHVLNSRLRNSSCFKKNPNHLPRKPKLSCPPDKEILHLTLGLKFLSYSDYPTQGKIKIENSRAFDMH